MRILITNDDGYKAKGIKVLAGIMENIGDVTVVGPKSAQSGMSMAISIGFKQLAFKKLSCGEHSAWNYLDATPATCVKFAMNMNLCGGRPDVIVSGINHGSNASTAACYSGTLGAAEEGALNGIPAIGVSIDSHDPDADFSAIEHYFPDIFNTLMNNYPKAYGIYYNINFPDLPADKIKGIRVGYQGRGTWGKEFLTWEEAKRQMADCPVTFGKAEEKAGEDGEEMYMMRGEFIDNGDNGSDADHLLVKEGYISIVAHRVDGTDYDEIARLRTLGLDKDFDVPPAYKDFALPAKKE